MKISQTLKTDIHDHLADLKTCPHCGHEEDFIKVWLNHVVAVILEPTCYKKGHVAVLMECQKCFEKSWVHQAFSGFNKYSDWPKEVVEKVTHLKEKSRIVALQKWADSKCANCKSIKTVDCNFDSYDVYRTCDAGMGPPIPANQKCSLFVQRL